MEENKQEVNLIKVYGLIKKIGIDLKKFNRMEKEVFFNAIKKMDLLMDQELCDNILAVGFKKKTPQIKEFMKHLKGSLAEKIKQLRGMQDEK